MKIRQGFVSNSSSSSFVVAFPRKPKNANDIKEMLFGDQEMFPHPYADVCYDDYPKNYPTEQVAKTVWEDMKRRKPNVRKRIHDSIRRGWFDEYKGLPGHDEECWNKIIHLNYKEDREEVEKLQKEEQKINDQRANDIINKFMEENKDGFVYVFNYADEDGHYGSALEHGDLFERLPHIRTSYH